MYKKYDWKQIQKYYDENHTTREVIAKFGMAIESLRKAKRRRDFFPRTQSVAQKLMHQIHGPMIISDDTRRRISHTVNKRIENGTWHVSLAKNMWKTYKGVKFHGTWEVEYAKWLDENNKPWRRPTESFQYEFQGKKRRYTPDFYLLNEQTYVEIKGYETEKDVAKWSQFPLKLKVLKEDELKKMGIIE